MNVDTIELFEKAKILERRFSFIRELQLRADDGADVLGCILMFTGNSKIIDLTQEKNWVTVDDSTIDIAGMCGGFESKLR